MAKSFELVEAFVTLAAKGGPAAKQALEDFLKDANKLTRNLQDQQSNMKSLVAAYRDFQLAALGGSVAITGMVRAASPAHFDTLTGSISLLAGSVGEAFLPAIERAIDYIQDLDRWFRSLDPATKEQIVTWATWTAAVVAAGVILPRVIGFLALLSGVFLKLATAVGIATKAMILFALSNPVTAILALVGAVIALGAAWDSISGRGEGLEGGLRAPIRAGEAAAQASLVRQVLNRTRSMGLFEAPTQNPGAFRRDQLVRAGVRPDIADELYSRGGIGGTGGIFGSGGRTLSPEQIAAAVAAVRGNDAARAVAAAAGGTAGIQTHPRLISTHFQAQLGGVETAWQRLQLAAAGMGSLEEERFQRQMRTLEQIEANTRPPGVPQPPGAGGLS